MYKGGNILSAFLRKFVILEEQPEYYMKVQGLTPKGYANIEVRDGKGKLTLNVDNLKTNLEEGKLYKACLIGVDKNGYVDVDLGVIVLNDKGKGTIEWKFDPARVGGTSLSIDKFNNIIVKEVDMSKEDNDIVIPLSGYIYKKDGSLAKFIKSRLKEGTPRKQEAVRIEEIVEVKQEVVKADEIEKEEIKVNSSSQEDIDKVNEDTYISSEETSEEDSIEKSTIEQTEDKININEVNSEDIIQQQEVKHIEEVKDIEKVKEAEDIEEVEKLLEEIPTQIYESHEIEQEKLPVEDLSFDDIFPLGFDPEEFYLQDLDIEKEKESEKVQKIGEVKELIEEESTENIEIFGEVEKLQDIDKGEVELNSQEKIQGAGTIWIDLETGEEWPSQEELSQEEFVEINDYNDEEDSYMTIVDDPVQNYGVIYNYNEYIDNTYGSKINKIEPYIMDTAKNYSMQVANYTMDILKFFNKVEPFKEKLRGCSWWRIEHGDSDISRGFLPFYNYVVNVYYPYPLTSKITTCQSLIEKYGHYIFGTVAEGEEIKYYVYGVPGQFTIAEHPYNGATGFNTWLKDKNSTDGLGYWLMYINALSGKIVNPVNPTIPIR